MNTALPPHDRPTAIQSRPHGWTPDPDRVIGAIQTLPEKYRVPMLLRYMERMSYSAIGVKTRRSADAVRKMLFEANRLLSRELASDLAAYEGQRTEGNDA